MDDLLQQGITAYRAGKRDEARKIFMSAVKQNPDSESSWGWMYQTSNNDQERTYCLKQILRINPSSEKASQLLAKLTATDFPLEQPTTPPKAAESFSEQKPRPLPPQKIKKQVAPQKPFDMKQLGIVGVVVLCIFCICIGVFSLSGNNSNPNGVNANEEDTNAWVPSGFEQWDNETAYRYVNGIGCSYSTGKCSHVEVYARYGCPDSLYVEVAFLSSNGTQVDWSNDTATSLPSGAKAILEFTSFDNSATKSKVTKISCY